MCDVVTIKTSVFCYIMLLCMASFTLSAVIVINVTVTVSCCPMLHCSYVLTCYVTFELVTFNDLKTKTTRNNINIHVYMSMYVYSRGC